MTAPEESRWSDVGGRAVHARCWLDPRVPSDPAVVLVHGLGVASRMCQPVARRLAARHHVYAPDLPGFGRSAKPSRTLDIDELGDALGRWLRVQGLSRAVVVGVSVGAQVAAAAAEQRPDRAGHLVLASPTVDPDRRRWRSQLWRWQVEQATQSARLRAIQVHDYARCRPSRVIRTFSAAMRDRIEDRVPRLDAPVLVCWGTRDPLVRRRFAAELAARARRGRLAVLPGAVHNLSHENPLELSRVVEHFVSQTRERSSGAA